MNFNQGYLILMFDNKEGYLMKIAEDCPLAAKYSEHFSRNEVVLILYKY